MRRVLDMLYRAAGGLAALFIVAIVALVFAQVGLNLADKITAAITGLLSARISCSPPRPPTP